MGRNYTSSVEKSLVLFQPTTPGQSYLGPLYIESNYANYVID
jgi:hypothetical protein